MKNSKEYIQLSQLTDMSSPQAVFEEVKCNFIHCYPIAEYFAVRRAFKDFDEIYAGKHTGYKSCNTKYHDVGHVTEALLALSRLIDGYNIKNKNHRFKCKDVVNALVAAIFHDSGYIQSSHDSMGTGAKYTLTHVERSMNFIKKYYSDSGYGRDGGESCARMIECTGLKPAIDKIKFRSHDEKVLGQMVGTADMIGQMASRNYLEKLIFLYREFKEGHVKGFTSEFDMLEKTFKFYSETEKKLRESLGDVNKYAAHHFKKIYGINQDMYKIAIGSQINYLKKILTLHKGNYKEMLRRV